MGIASPAARESIKIRSLVVVGSREADVTQPDVIAEDEDNVRLLGCISGAEGHQGQKKQGTEQYFSHEKRKYRGFCRSQYQEFSGH